MAQLEPVPIKSALSDGPGHVTPPWQRWLRTLHRRIRQLGTLSLQDADDVTVDALTVNGIATFSNAVNIDRTGDATWAQILYDADSANQQRAAVTDASDAVVPVYSFTKSTDVLTIGDTGYASIDFAANDYDFTSSKIYMATGNLFQHDGSSFIASTTEYFTWLTSGGAEYYLYNSGRFDTYMPSASANSTAWNLRSDVSPGKPVVFRVEVDGDVYNTNNTYGAISDARLKENIVDAPSQWDDVRAMRFRKFNMIGSDLTQLGVIAQELQDVCPGLVSENEDGMLAVKYSALMMKVAAALQEAMARIEALEQEKT